MNHIGLKKGLGGLNMLHLARQSHISKDDFCCSNLYRGFGRCLKLTFVPTECNGFRVDRDREHINDSDNPRWRKHRF